MIGNNAAKEIGPIRRHKSGARQNAEIGLRKWQRLIRARLEQYAAVIADADPRIFNDATAHISGDPEEIVIERVDSGADPIRRNGSECKGTRGDYGRDIKAGKGRWAGRERYRRRYRGGSAERRG